jgi:hypothetical protein
MKTGICGSSKLTKPPSTRVLTIRQVITTFRTGMSIRKAGTSISEFTLFRFERATASTTFSSTREPVAHLREPCQPSAAPLHSAGAGSFSAWSFPFPTFAQRLALPLLFSFYFFISADFFASLMFTLITTPLNEILSNQSVQKLSLNKNCAKDACKESDCFCYTTIYLLHIYCC